MPSAGDGRLVSDRPPRAAAFDTKEAPVDSDLTERLFQLEARLDYQFLNLSILQRALTHSSCRNHLADSNERLEFLGDAVLGLVVTEHLFRLFPTEEEGEMTRIKSIVVSRAALARIANDMDLGSFLILGKGLGKPKSLPVSLLANAFEAVIAAIYLDGGIAEARRFILRHLASHIQLATEEAHSQNFKSILQQHAQRELGLTPTYRVVHEQGPDHIKSFTVVAIIGSTEYGKGSGASKKEAEQRAAQETLSLLINSPPPNPQAPSSPAETAPPTSQAVES